MYLCVTTFRPMPGRDGELIAWMKEVAAIIDKGYLPPAPCQVFSERLGDHGTAYLTMQLRDSAEIDRVFAWAGQSQELHAVMRQGNEAAIYVPGSRHDRLLVPQ